MTVARESLIMSLLATLFEGSLLKRICLAIGRAFTNSAIMRFFYRDGVIFKAHRDSALMAAVSNVLNAPAKGLGFLLQRFKLFRKSFVLTLLSAFGQRSYLLIGALFAVAVVTPHAKWNNIYAFAGMVLILLVYLLGAAKKPALRIDLRALSPYIPMFFLLVLYGFVSSVNIGLSMRFVLFHITCAIVVLIVVANIHTVEELQRLVTIVLFAVTLAGLYGCYQGVKGVAVVANQVDLTQSLNATMPGRVYSTFDNPNNFGELLVMMIPFYFAMMMNSRSRFSKLVFGLGVLPPLLALAMTYFRTGWIALVLSALVFILLTDWRILPLFLFCGVAALPILPVSITNRLLTILTGDSSTEYRILIYKSFFTMLKDHWVTGAGLGSDAVVQMLKQYPPLSSGSYALHAHNNYVQVCGEMGFLASLTFVSLSFNTVKQGFKNARRAPARVKMLLTAGISAAAGILLICFTEYTWYYPRVMFVFWLLFAIIWAGVKLAVKGNNQE